jgi:hypothetical protein
MRYWYLPDAPDQDARAAPGPPAPEYRVLVPARPMAPEELHARLRDVSWLAGLIAESGGRVVGVTYAMAEEIATATLIESVALRFVLAHGSWAGVALWWDWRWHGAIVPADVGGILTRERLELLIATGSSAVPLFACERCAREGLKRNKDQSLRAHKRLNWHPPYREECK